MTEDTYSFRRTLRAALVMGGATLGLAVGLDTSAVRPLAGAGAAALLSGHLLFLTSIALVEFSFVGRLAGVLALASHAYRELRSATGHRGRFSSPEDGHAVSRT